MPSWPLLMRKEKGIVKLDDWFKWPVLLQSIYPNIYQVCMYHYWFNWCWKGPFKQRWANEAGKFCERFGEMSFHLAYSEELSLKKVACGCCEKFLHHLLCLSSAQRYLWAFISRLHRRIIVRKSPMQKSVSTVEHGHKSTPTAPFVRRRGRLCRQCQVKPAWNWARHDMVGKILNSHPYSYRVVPCSRSRFCPWGRISQNIENNFRR